jgi:uncharacterized membrane protein YphA (DoxX/SURF4 family)
MALDPAIQVSLRAGLAFLFLWAVLHKLRDLAGFRAVVRNYRIVPESWLDSLSSAVIVMEICVSLGLVVPWWAPGAAAAAALLLLAYTTAIALNLARGRRDIDCGCAGLASSQPLGIALVARNLVLVGLALASALPTAPRRLMWIDAFTVPLLTVLLLLLYAAADGTLANGTKLAALAGRRHTRA